jgi:dTDP-4-dehydrorhamnose 3,5-epimerase-like enzyme
MSLRDARWIDLTTVEDDRGMLTALQAGADVPFEIRRVFFLHNVRASRGGHAHRSSRQLVVAAAGTFRVELSDARDSAIFEFTQPNRGLYIPPMTWVCLDNFSADAVCLVLTDTPFDAADYLRDRRAFEAASRAATGLS